MGAVVVALRGASWVVASVILVAPLAAHAGVLDSGLPGGPPLQITGDVAGMAPGVPAPLVLTLRNGSDADVAVSSLRVVVSGGSDSCDASQLSVPAWTGRLVVPAGGRAQQTVTATVADDPACAAASWSMTFTAL